MNLIFVENLRRDDGYIQESILPSKTIGQREQSSTVPYNGKAGHSTRCQSRGI